MTTLPNGTKLFARRGKAPQLEEGYEIRNNDPFIHYLSYPPCEDRSQQEADCEGCGEGISEFCEVLKETVSAKSCLGSCPKEDID